ncbi:uncharacterized protein LOC141785459 [Halichoeres trimaculatus]|uniref:uncharacterized protein LOC141785459 n=1 Tax=Halichoeres trimaculatus TaxID=147232 RepID=UPI003D9DD250
MKNETGHGSTCGSDSGVNLAVFDFAVKIETHPKGQNLSAVTVGQRITLTCVPTCPSSLNSPLGYIWYKNQQHSTELKADSQVLSLDPVSYDDTGSYVCAFMGLEDLRSSPTEIRVQRKHRDTAPVSSATPAKDGVPSLSYDSQNSTDQRFNNYQTPANKDLLKVSVTLVTSVSVGFAIGMSLTVLIFKLKCRDKKKRKEYVSSVGKCPNPNTDSYDTLGVRCMSSEYEMLNAVKGCSAEADYENLQLRNFME